MSLKTSGSDNDCKIWRHFPILLYLEATEGTICPALPIKNSVPLGVHFLTANSLKNHKQYSNVTFRNDALFSSKITNIDRSK